MISPESGGEMKFMHLSKVLLPEPLGPIMQTTSPFLTDKLISFNTSNVPKLFETFLTSRSGCAEPNDTCVDTNLLPSFKGKRALFALLRHFTLFAFFNGVNKFGREVFAFSP